MSLEEMMLKWMMKVIDTGRKTTIMAIDMITKNMEIEILREIMMTGLRVLTKVLKEDMEIEIEETGITDMVTDLTTKEAAILIVIEETKVFAIFVKKRATLPRIVQILGKDLLEIDQVKDIHTKDKTEMMMKDLEWFKKTLSLSGVRRTLMNSNGVHTGTIHPIMIRIWTETTVMHRIEC